jgi:hypothetical protein
MYLSRPNIILGSSTIYLSTLFLITKFVLPTPAGHKTVAVVNTADAQNLTVFDYHFEDNISVCMIAKE